MKTLLTTIIAALVMSTPVFAGTGTLFRDGIGLPDWSFTSPAKNNTAKRATAKTPAFPNKPIDG
jgi:hypothetical protein